MVLLFPKGNPVRAVVVGGCFLLGLFPLARASDLVVAGGGGLLRLDGESGELRQLISGDTNFTSVRTGPDGDLFALKASTGTLYRFARPSYDLAGQFNSSSLQGAAAFAFDSDGRLISARNALIHRYQEDLSSPAQTIDLHGAGMRVAAGLAFGPDGLMYVSCRHTGRIFRVNPETEAVSAMPDRFGIPRGMAFDQDGALLATDTGLLPALVRLAGDDRGLGGFFPGDLPDGITFQQPFDLAIDFLGRVVVADLLANRILRFDSGLAFMDTPGEGSAAWLQPRSVTFTIQPSPIESFSDWRQEHFSPPEREDESVSGLYGNPSGDGKPNLLRYALGAGPMESVDDRLPVWWTDRVDGQEYLFVRSIAARGLSDVEVRLEVSSDLVGWVFSSDRLAVVEVENLGDLERVTRRDTVPIGASDRRFVRIRVIYTPVHD